MTPAEYANRFLPIQVPVPGGTDTIPVNIERYRLGTPKPSQQQLWGALGDHFVQNKNIKNYRLTLKVNNVPLSIGNKIEILMPAVRPFWGKGSPEDCQIVMQLALLLKITTATQAQTWANDNIGLDCNGFVGNYIWHDYLGTDWRVNDKEKVDPGSNMSIDGYWDFVVKQKYLGPLGDLKDLDPKQMYLVVRTDQNGKVIPGPNPVGHVALTEPGQFQASFQTADGAHVAGNMVGKSAVRTVESAGLVKGVGQNWLVFVNPQQKGGVFTINRDNIPLEEPVRLIPLKPKADVASAT